MTGAWLWTAVAALTGGALVLAWPHRTRRPGNDGRSRLPAVRDGVTGLVLHPVRTISAAGAFGALLGWGLAGGTAAVLAGGYVALVARALIGRHRARMSAAARHRALDDLCALAADLRAGLPPATQWLAHSVSSGAAAGAVTDDAAGGAPSTTAADGRGSGRATSGRAEPSDLSPAHRIARLSAAVWQLAERTGAPAADLVERIEADARAGDRLHARTAAEAAGARATAILLAALPAGGLALGSAIGGDPLHVLLHTPIGAACAVGALLLQIAGLSWSDRLVRGNQ